MSKRDLSRLVGLVCSAILVTALADVACSGQLPASERTRRVKAMYERYKAEDFPTVEEISAGDLLDSPDSLDVLLVDVRSRRERKVSIIAGAIDRRQFEEHRQRYHDRTIVVYCTIGYRSGLYTEKLEAQGFDARNLAGGILAWVQEGGLVVDGQNATPTKRVHVYGPKWNLLPDGYRGIW